MMCSGSGGSCVDPGGGGNRGSGSPLKNTKYKVLNNISPDPLDIIKLPSKHSMLGHHRHASETSFEFK